MNIIVTNKYQSLFNNNSIEVIKELRGVFKVSDIVNSIGSIFYRKIIIDVTAIQGFPKEEVVRELARFFPLDKLILFLAPDNPAPRNFLSFLVNLNIYNFTDNMNGLLNLISRSNTYEDVKNFIVTKEEKVETETEDFGYKKDSDDKIVLGIKNVTEGVYSTILSYMIKKSLTNVHQKDSIAIEINNNNFVFYNDKDMHSLRKENALKFLNLSNTNITLVDFGNNDVDSNLCTDAIYLIDPSLYNINKLVYNDHAAFSKLKGKKVIFVNSLLSDKDVTTFAREANISVYFNLPPLNDRIHNKVLDSLLSKLGLIEEVTTQKTKKGLFDLFK